MSQPPAVDRLVEKVLETRGLVPLEVLLAQLVPIHRLRAVAQERGVSPKGFRIDSAPAPSLAQALVRDLDPELLAAALCELFAALRPVPTSGPRAETPPAPSEPQDKTPARLAAELERVQGQLAAALAAQQGREARIADFDRRTALLQQEVARQRGELAAAQAQQASRPAGGRDGDREAERRLHAAEAELEVLARTEEDYRRRLAEQQTAIRALEQRVEELEAMVPKNRRRRPPPSPPPVLERFRMPHLTPEFYRTVAGRDQRSVAAAFDAIWRFATSGYSYPGLEVKQLEGVDLWSMRAGIKVRVYFRPRTDGDVDIVAVGDREDQDTLLRRLR